MLKKKFVNMIFEISYTQFWYINVSEQIKDLTGLEKRKPKTASSVERGW